MTDSAIAQEYTDINAYITVLWDLYAKPIKAYLSKSVGWDETEDLVQIVFERLYASLSKQKTTKETIRNIGPYIYAIARNVYKDALRKREKDASLYTYSPFLSEDDDPDSIVASLPDPNASPEDEIINREVLIAHIKQLSPLEQRIFAYIYIRDMTVREISDYLDISVSIVSLILSRARRKFRESQRRLESAEDEANFRKESIEAVHDLVDNDQDHFYNNEQKHNVTTLSLQISQLPEPYRSVLTLTLVEKRKYVQIAALRRCPLGTIKGQVSRGMRLLKALTPSENMSEPQSPVRKELQQTPIVLRELPHVEDLPEHHRTILVLREIHGSSYAQIATQLQISLSLVKRRLYRARIAYRDLLHRQMDQTDRPVVRRRSIPLEQLSRLNHSSYRHFYEVLYLAYVDHLSDREIAERLHRPVNTVKAHIARGVKLLTSEE